MQHLAQVAVAPGQRFDRLQRTSIRMSLTFIQFLSPDGPDYGRLIRPRHDCSTVFSITEHS